jgi:hypothetical protein
MLQRHRAPGIDPRPAQTVKGLEHLKDEWVAILRWLGEGKVEHVLVGPAGEAIRGSATAFGPVAIVPAPYRRNLDRLASSLLGAQARLRTAGMAATTPIRFTAAKLAAGGRWSVRSGVLYELDIEIVPPERYSELLYEAGRFEIEPGLSVEVGSPEDLQQHSHVPLLDEEPEIRVTRGPVMPQNTTG